MSAHPAVSASGYTLLGALIGIFVYGTAVLLIPKLLAKITPAIDEEKEILRGNQAVANYYGRLVGATIIGFSIIIAAAILAGIS